MTDEYRSLVPEEVEQLANQNTRLEELESASVSDSGVATRHDDRAPLATPEEISSGIAPRTRRALTEAMMFRCSRKAVGTKFELNQGVSIQSTSVYSHVRVQTGDSASLPAV